MPSGHTDLVSICPFLSADFYPIDFLLIYPFGPFCHHLNIFSDFQAWTQSYKNVLALLGHGEKCTQIGFISHRTWIIESRDFIPQ